MSDRLRIAHFTIGRCNPDSANGIDKAISSLSAAQARLGQTVSVFSLTAKPPLPIPGVEVYCYAPRKDGSETATRSLFDIRRFSLPKRLVQHVLAWRPDVVHLHSVHVPENIALGSILRRAGIPYGVSVHGGLSPVIRKRHRWTKLLLRMVAERKHLQAAAFLHAITSGDADAMRAYGLSRPVVVSPNGIELAAVPHVSNPHLLTELHPEVRGRRVFLFVGRVDPTTKGLDLLLDAFARTPLGWALVLIGPGRGSDLQRLRELSRRLGLGSSVVFAGPAYGQTKYDLLAGAHVFVHPSRTEAGLPFSVLEAAALGKPCLVTQATDPSGLLARYGAGIVVPAEADEIANALASFASMDAARLTGMGANARTMVEREFRWEPIAGTIIDSYCTFAVGAHV